MIGGTCRYRNNRSDGLEGPRGFALTVIGVTLKNESDITFVAFSGNVTSRRQDWRRSSIGVNRGRQRTSGEADSDCPSTGSTRLRSFSASPFVNCCGKQVFAAGRQQFIAEAPRKRKCRRDTVWIGGGRI